MGPDSIQDLRAASVGPLVILFVPRWNSESIRRSYPSLPQSPPLSHVTPLPFVPSSPLLTLLPYIPDSFYSLSPPLLPLFPLFYPFPPDLVEHPLGRTQVDVGAEVTSR